MADMNRVKKSGQGFCIHRLTSIKVNGKKVIADLNHDNLRTVISDELGMMYRGFRSSFGLRSN